MIVACFERNTMARNADYELVNFVPFRFRHSSPNGQLLFCSNIELIVVQFNTFRGFLYLPPDWGYIYLYIQYKYRAPCGHSTICLTIRSYLANSLSYFGCSRMNFNVKQTFVKAKQSMPKFVFNSKLAFIIGGKVFALCA